MRWKYPCVPLCKRGSNTPRGLSVHQSSCKLSREHDLANAQSLAKKLREAREATKQAALWAHLPSRPQPAPTLPVSSSSSRDTLDTQDVDLQDDHIPDDPPPSSTLDERDLGRGRRSKRPTWKILEQRVAIRGAPSEALPDVPLPPTPDPLPQFEAQRTRTTHYGLYCQYLSVVPATSHTQFTPTPIHFVEPASSVPLALRNRVLPTQPSQHNDVSLGDMASLGGCSNMSSKLIMDWHWSSGTKSLENTNLLVHTVMRSNLIQSHELEHFDARRETRQIDAALAKLSDCWLETSVDISVPDGKPHPKGGATPIPIFTVDGLVHRSLTQIIRSVWTSADSSEFQYIPFRQYWKRGPGLADEQVHGEFFTSEACNTAYEDLQSSSPEPDCNLERVICALMLYSDSTHLANFGSAALWPLYMYFGNQSKYVRACPSSGSCHHVAYIPKLPDSFHDWYLAVTGEGPPAEVLTHCRRELMHAVLQIVLDDDFIYACTHGIVLQCGDGVTWRVYPRLFTYSADYPEKVLLATVRNLGKCPCPRCLLPKARISDIGMHYDFSRRVNLQRSSGAAQIRKVTVARAAIYEWGKGLKSTAVENLLGAESYVPTVCCLPVLEGLFHDTTHDRAIQDLIFTLAEWHACAKLRLHTTSTLSTLKDLTRLFGIRIRHFANKLTPEYDTKELPKEEAARIRRHVKQVTQGGAAAPTRTRSSPIKKKVFCMTTYKLHTMGDYVSQIVQFGTTDSYSTQSGELEHRSVKRYYTQTNKINATLQMARIHRRERALRKALEQRHQATLKAQQLKRKVNKDGHYKSIKSHHFISHSRNFALRIWSWLEANHSLDLRYKGFIFKLHNHLVGRMQHPDMADDGTQYEAQKHAEVSITNGCFFEHKTLQVNYTTYDMRREYDIVNPRKHANIMSISSDLDPNCLTSPTGHPFRYARVLGIYHADVARVLPGIPVTSQTLEFLFVHWYRRVDSFKAGFQSRRLHRLELIPPDEPDACGFLDPDDVVRGAHLIPTFACGTLTTPGLADSVHDQDAVSTWRYFYVNVFADRDMYMRYKGGGIGHLHLDVDDPEPEPDEIVTDALHEAIEDADHRDIHSTNDVPIGHRSGEEPHENEDSDLGEDDEELEEEEMAELASDEQGDGLEDDRRIVDLMNDTLGYGTL
ncbi:hypothetical protein QCA50_007305 [Cerrena zonata]|uniref:Uncharacterized protein n=1 Tax=Cerrena zonata TaxID=2478898 RepID=A0AAW0G777_9APHY